MIQKNTIFYTLIFIKKLKQNKNFGCWRNDRRFEFSGSTLEKINHITPNFLFQPLVFIKKLL